MNNFLETLTVALNERNIDIATETVTKNNGVQLVAIRKKGENITPTVYMEDFFEEFQNGRSINRIADEIVAIMEDNQCPFQSAEEVKNRILDKRNLRVRLVSGVRNESDEYVTREVFGGELKIEVYSEIEVGATTKIRKEFTSEEYFNMTEDEILEVAISNTIEKGFTILSMFDMLAEMFGLNEEVPIPNGMYIITNERKYFGAVAMLDTVFLKNVSEKTFEGKGFYILPSSIHECICIRADRTEEDTFRNMVREINLTEVSEQEILSDEIFYYDAELEKVVICK